jgi:peptide/nickel transport system permease protein
MTQYIVRRLLFVPPLLLVGSLLIFLLLRVVPGDPAAGLLGDEAMPEDIEAFREKIGLNHSLPRQYADWLKSAVTGELGRSIVTNQPVGPQILKRLPVTVEILVLSLVMGTAIGVAFGIASALFQDTPLDYGVRVFSVAALSVPAFFALTLLILLPSIWFNYVPPFGYVSPLEDPWKNARMFLPPTLLLSVESSAGLMRYTRSVFLDVMRQDYVRTARAKGLAERVVVSRHMLKNAMVPVVTIIGARIAGLLGGSVILEQVMSLSGIGQFTYQAVISRDYPVVQTMALYIGAVVALSHLVVDISYAYFDPRIRYR